MHSATGIFLRLFTPREPAEAKKRTMPEFPEGDISFLLDIPAIQSFKPIKQQGPNSQPGNIRIKKATKGCTWMWFSISDKTCFYDERPPDFKHRAAFRISSAYRRSEDMTGQETKSVR